MTLDGTGSTDPDAGDILSYQWSAVDVTFDDATSATPSAHFPLGSTTVNLTVVDQCGAESTSNVLIIIEDNTAPQIQAAVVDNASLWPPNHQMIPIALDFLVSDECTDPADLILVCTVESNEADDANGDGSSSGDVDGQDGHTHPVTLELNYDSATGRWMGDFALRAERNGGNQGRKYSIRCMAADPSGNMTYATVCVTVPKSRGRNR